MEATKKTERRTFNVVATITLNKHVAKSLTELVGQFPEDYPSKSQAIRSAVMMLHRNRMGNPNEPNKN